MRPIKIAGKVIGVLMVIALASLLFGLFVQMLWNGLIPGIFPGVHIITFWQAVGLLILAKILFSRGWGGHRGWRNHGCYGGRWGQWHNMTPEERQKMKEEWKEGWYGWKNKWHNMTPEQKAAMKAQWKERCSRWDNRHPVDALVHEDETRTE